MSLHQDNFNNYSPAGFNQKCEIEGLSLFAKILEKNFFSTVTIRNYTSENSLLKLVIELDCNYTLNELMHHLDLGTWGNFKSNEFSLFSACQGLKEENEVDVEIEEFCIFLKDTTIIVNKIYQNSIQEQLEAVLEKIQSNFVYFTKGLTEMPYEIYVPVFEECLSESEKTLLNIKTGNNTAKDYFKFWGLYFYSEEDAQIYDVKNTSIISGHMEMLNR